MRGRRRTNNWYSILVKIILAFVFFGFVVEELYGFSLYGFSLLLPEQYIPRSSRSNTRSSTLVLCFVFVQCLNRKILCVEIRGTTKPSKEHETIIVLEYYNLMSNCQSCIVQSCHIRLVKIFIIKSYSTL